ncbi:hypothetical protein [Duganella sp. CF517]|uniref:hypothetical protein n=1 Tax=Duganella sp. CF517 TaxID=1881038 RepID=UPI001160B2C1|nr:hypothetical protein [Duganella sp. CF517]
MHERTPTVNPYQRIRAAGFDITVGHISHSYRLNLVVGGRVYAQIECSRSGNMNAGAALARVKSGNWGPTSSVYKALDALADVAEKQALIVQE